MARKPKPIEHDYGHGTVSLNGTKWRIRWRENGQRMAWGGWEDQGAAESELAAILARIELGQPGRPSVAAPVHSARAVAATDLGKLAEEWVEHRVTFDVRTAKEERARWNLHIAPALEGVRVEAITVGFVKHLAAELVKPTPGTKRPDGKRKTAISGRTATRALRLLSGFLGWLAKHDSYKHLVTENAAREALTDLDVKRLLATKSHKAPGAKKVLTRWEDVDRLYAALEAPTSILYLVCARAGLRPGEALALRWGDVDLAKGEIHVRQQARHGKLGPTKGNKVRTVPVVPFVVEELKAWKASSVKADANLVPDMLVCRPVGGNTSARFVSPKTVNAQLEAGLAKAKLPPATLYEYGRHSYGTILGNSGRVSAFRLRDLMGHSDIKTTLGYVHSGEGLSADELEALGG
jgi:integrase